MGDPAEENDPPPESRRCLIIDIESVNWKNEKTRTNSFTLLRFADVQPWRTLRANNILDSTNGFADPAPLDTLHVMVA